MAVIEYANQADVKAFLAAHDQYSGVIAPPPIFEAHIANAYCESDTCPICNVYCRVCGLSYNYEEICPYH
jgi:hypothetical protein